MGKAGPKNRACTELRPLQAVMSSASSASSHGTPSMSILDTISLLVSSDRPSLCIIDFDRRPVAIVSYSDLMDYIQVSIHHTHREIRLIS